QVVLRVSIPNTEHSIKEMERLTSDEAEAKRASKKELSDKFSPAICVANLPKRYIALKVMYFGPRFYGFASEAQMGPTVESEIFEALQKTRLISGNKKELQYSRCGRTDKGVSSVGQVISLFLRSNIKDTVENNDNTSVSPDGEIDYVKVLNKVLPKDIRITGWSSAPNDFSSRFSCLGREYMYFFWRGNLDIEVMQNAGTKFIGEHDFRNFCKMDAANVQNFKRRITSFEILRCSEKFEDDELWAVKIKGSAFLWHQIRCMVAVLFLIGQRLESPSVIGELLDIETTPRKPQYTMAPEIPLLLHCCEFDCLDFKCSTDARRGLRVHLEKQCRDYKLQAAIFHEALSSCCSSSESREGDPVKEGGKKKKSSCRHVPLMCRQTGPSFDERRAKL
ncbi:hypothetical protein M569_01328, partial [Genlisea aurea]